MDPTKRYVEPTRRCINFRCKHRTTCAHATKQGLYEHLYSVEERQSYIVQKMFPAINPVACVCDRWKKEKPILPLMDNSEYDYGHNVNHNQNDSEL